MDNIIIGRKPVLEAILSNKEIEKIYILFNSNSDIINRIKTEAKKRKIPISELPKQKFSKFGSENNTQGVVAQLSQIKFYDLDYLINYASKNSPNIIVILEEIQDTHNLGAILRTCECFGIKCVVITKNNSATINDTVFKTSAGAVNHLFIHKTHSIQQTLSVLKDNNFWIYGSSLKDSSYIQDVKKVFPAAILVGNEEKGLKVSTLKNCDFKIKIPMLGKLDSLNVSVATGVILYDFIKGK